MTIVSGGRACYDSANEKERPARDDQYTFLCLRFINFHRLAVVARRGGCAFIYVMNVGS
jgi:hypothetical protein